MYLPSAVRNAPMNGLVVYVDVPGIALTKRLGSLGISIATSIEQAVAHIPVESSDTSTSVASPVRSRWNRAAAIPPAMFMPPMVSP